MQRGSFRGHGRRQLVKEYKELVNPMAQNRAESLGEVLPIGGQSTLIAERP